MKTIFDLGKFISVGLFNSLLTQAAYATLVPFLDITVSYLVALSIGILITYLGHSSITFRTILSTKGFFLYFSYYVLYSLMVYSLVLWLYEYFRLDKRLCLLVATIILLPLNFTCTRFTLEKLSINMVSGKNIFFSFVIISLVIDRLFYINLGLPLFLSADEEVLVGGSAKLWYFLLTSADLSQSGFYYPIGLAVFYAIPNFFSSIAIYFSEMGRYLSSLGLTASEIIAFQYTDLIIGSRLFTFFTFLMFIFLIHRILGALKFGGWSYVSTLLLMIVNPYLYLVSHFSRHWVLSLLLMLTTVFACARCRGFDRWFWIAIGTGIFAFHTSYGVAGSVFLAVGYLIAKTFVSVDFRLKSRDSFGLVFSVICFLAMIALYPDPLIRLLSGSVVPVYEVYDASRLIDTIFLYAVALFLGCPGALMLVIDRLKQVKVDKGSICGLSVRVTRAFEVESFRERFQLFSRFTIGVYLFVLVTLLPLEDRYILPISVFMAFEVGYLIERFSKRSRIILLSVVSYCVFLPFVLTAKLLILFAAEDTRNELNDKLIEGDAVFVEGFSWTGVIASSHSLDVEKSIRGHVLEKYISLSGRLSEDRLSNYYPRTDFLFESGSYWDNPRGLPELMTDLLGNRQSGRIWLSPKTRKLLDDNYGNLKIWPVDSISNGCRNQQALDLKSTIWFPISMILDIWSCGRMGPNIMLYEVKEDIR